MKKILLITALLVSFGIGSAAQAQNVAINTDGTAADNSAILDVKSDAKGLLVPRMTATERGNIANPATGLIVYQTNGTAGFYYNVGTPASPNWVILLNGGAAAGGDLTGTYPNPTIANNAVTTAKIADGTIVNADIANTTIGVGKINATGTASATTFLRGDGSWQTPAGGGGASVQVVAVKTATQTAAAISTDTDIVFNSTTTSPTAGIGTFDGTTYTVGASGAGTYLITAHATAAISTQMGLYIQSSLQGKFFGSDTAQTNFPAPLTRASVTAVITLAVGETIKVVYSSALTATTINGNNNCRLNITKLN